MRDIGNGDDDDMAARIRLVRVGSGPDGVVVIARIFRIDGNERNISQIGAARNVCRFGVFGFADCFRAEAGWYSMRVDGDEADRLGLIHGAEAFGNPRAGKARFAPGERFDHHQLASRDVFHVPRIDNVGVARFAVDRFDADVLPFALHDPQYAMGTGAKPFYDAAFEAIFFL